MPHPITNGSAIRMTDIEKRFWSKVEVKERHDCWFWRAGKDKNGYGMFWIKPQNQPAHKVAYKFEFGSFEKGLHVLHKCDNPSCVNPYHLFLGTNQDNIKDMIKKGRSLKGEKAHSAKLTEIEVKQIKKLINEGMSSGMISKRFKVHKSTIKDIKALRTWIHITL